MSDEQQVEEQATDEVTGVSGKAYVIVMSFSLAAYLLVLFLGNADTALTASLCMAMIVIAVGICWDLRTRFWFWVVIALVMALHVPLVLLVRWPHHWIPGIALAPIGLMDCMIIVGIVHFVQKYIVKDVPSDENG